MKRTEEDQAVIDRGKLWIEFKNTEWFKDLMDFINTQIETLKDSVVTLTLEKEYEQAKAEAQKLAAFKDIKNFIENDGIEAMQSLIQEEQAERTYKEGIPSHV